jgi:hypothetical protein
MRGIKTLGIGLFALLALGAPMAGTASAASKLILRTAGKGVLAAGAEIKISNPGLLFVTANFNMECTENALTGTLTNNSAAKDKMNIGSERSTGGEPEEACKTTGVLGYVKIKADDLPWTQELTTRGTGSTKGTKRVVFEWTFPAAGDVVCIWESPKVAETFTPGKAGSPTPFELNVKEQLFKRSKKGSNAACPTEGRLTGAFVIESGGETVESEL